MSMLDSNLNLKFSSSVLLRSWCHQVHLSSNWNYLKMFELGSSFQLDLSCASSDALLEMLSKFQNSKWRCYWGHCFFLLGWNWWSLVHFCLLVVYQDQLDISAQMVYQVLQLAMGYSSCLFYLYLAFHLSKDHHLLNFNSTIPMLCFKVTSYEIKSNHWKSSTSSNYA